MMRLLDPLLDAIRGLRANVMRSILTTLGIIIGVAAVIHNHGIGGHRGRGSGR